MGLRDLFSRRETPPNPPPAAPKPPRSSDAARVGSMRVVPKREGPKTITYQGREVPTPPSFLPRTPGQLHYTAKDVEQWNGVDLFDYWLDLNDHMHGGLSQVRTMPNYDRPRMDVEFDVIWRELTEKKTHRPGDVALLMRWSIACGELDLLFPRRGMLALWEMVPAFEEKTLLNQGIPARAFKDPVLETGHSIVTWKFNNLDKMMEILARTFGFPAVLAALKDINPRLGPDLARRACKTIAHEPTLLSEIAMMRAAHGELVADCPPDEWFLER